MNVVWHLHYVIEFYVRAYRLLFLTASKLKMSVLIVRRRRATLAHQSARIEFILNGEDLFVKYPLLLRLKAATVLSKLCLEKF